MQTQTNQESKTFSGWLNLYPTTFTITQSKEEKDLEFSKWLDKIALICHKHYVYNFKQIRKKESTYFRLALICALNIKYTRGEQTLKFIGSEIARVVKRKRPYTHCWSIHYLEVSQTAVEPNKGYQKFQDDFNPFKSELEKLGLL